MRKHFNSMGFRIFCALWFMFFAAFVLPAARADKASSQNDASLVGNKAPKNGGALERKAFAEKKTPDDLQIEPAVGKNPPAAGEERQAREEKASVAAKDEFVNPLGMKFVYCPPGTFTMGSPYYEQGRSDEETMHRVTLTRGFFIQTTLVTQELWRRVMGFNPSAFKDYGDDCPVEQVSWLDCREFFSKLNAMDAGRNYRLPTEAEWEYACRAGSTGMYYWGENENGAGDHGWYEDNSEKSTHPVAQKAPNAWGLYDMCGNVWEWCEDWYDQNYYRVSPGIDPKGPGSGQFHVVRGGSWDNGVLRMRSACRDMDMPDYRDSILGFRVAADAGR